MLTVSCIIIYIQYTCHSLFFSNNNTWFFYCTWPANLQNKMQGKLSQTVRTAVICIIAIAIALLFILFTSSPMWGECPILGTNHVRRYGKRIEYSHRLWPPPINSLCMCFAMFAMNVFWFSSIHQTKINVSILLWMIFPSSMMIETRIENTWTTICLEIIVLFMCKLTWLQKNNNIWMF